MIKSKIKSIFITICAILCLFLSAFAISALPTKKVAAVTKANVVSMGVDISQHQGNVNFDTLASKSDFVILRIGYGGTAPVLDSRFDSYLAAAQSRGLPIGVYIYSYAASTDRAIAEANWTLQQLNSRGLNAQKLTYPVFFDYEDQEYSFISQKSRAANTAIINAYLDTIRAGGYYPSLYTGGSIMQNSININDIHGDIWVAAYGPSWSGFTNAYYNSKVTMWQYNTGQYSDGTGDSVLGSHYGVSSTYIDQNYCFVDYPSVIRTSGLNGFTSLESKGHGFTLSDSDGDVNFSQLSTLDSPFAFVRMGNATSQTIDGKFVQNMQGLASIGKYRGVYIDSNAQTQAQAEFEALWTIGKLRDFDIGQVDYPIVFNYDFSVKDKTTTTAIVNGFVNTIRGNNGRGMLFTNGETYNNYIDKTALNCDVFLVYYAKTDDTKALINSGYYSSKVTIWQYSNGDSTHGYKYTAAQAGSSAPNISQNLVFADYPTELRNAGLNAYDALPTTPQPPVVEKVPHSISLATPVNGYIGTDYTSALEGTTVTVSTAPFNGYVVGAIYVNDVAIAGNTFTMPDTDVTVRVEFVLLDNDTIYNLSLATPENGYIGTFKGENAVSQAYAGETITVNTVPFDGYVVGAIYVNDSAIAGNTFIMPAENVTVRVTFVPGDSGTHSIKLATPVNGYIGTDPANSAKTGATVTVNTVPFEGYTVDTIYVNDVAITGNTFTMPSQAVTVRVTFTLINPIYSITAEPCENGSFTTNPTQAHVGETITVNAAANEGYQVDAVYVNGNVIDGNTFTMPANDTSVRVVFAPLPVYSIMLMRPVNGYIGTDVVQATAGQTVTVNAVPFTGYSVDTIYVDENPIVGNTFVMPNRDVRVSVTFLTHLPTYTATLSPTQNGSIRTDIREAVVGQKVTVDVLPDEGYQLAVLCVNGLPVSSTSFLMPEGNVTVEAVFRPLAKNHSITIATTQNGTITASVQNAAAGETVTITATPDEGYVLTGLCVNGLPIGKTNFIMPENDVTVVAIFTPVNRN